MATFYPGGYNVFVPNWAASNKMRIEFSRDPKDFAMNKYMGIRTVKVEVGLYLVHTAQQAARVPDVERFGWRDGEDAPEPHDAKESFSWPSYQCNRFAFPWELGERAVKNAEWPIEDVQNRVCAQQAMTARTYRLISMLTTPANWGASSVTAGSFTGGGAWSAAAVATPYILRTFLGAKISIWKSTLGAVKSSELKCVISPNTAAMIRATPEITDFIKQQERAANYVKETEFYGKWSIPEQIYGVPLVVEDAVRVTTIKNIAGTATSEFIMPDNYALFLTTSDSVSSGREAGEGTHNSATIFVVEGNDLTVETKTDIDNKKVKGRVIDFTDEVITSILSGRLVDITA